jgi:putative SOS response-associated peptidase YedK
VIEESKADCDCGIIVEAMQWGLYRPGSKDLVINGRFEELVNKPMFRGLLKKKRAIITVDGYYEWDETTTPGRLRPYLIKSANEKGTLFLACLYNNAFKSGP